jgi:hypothetical protein
MLQDSEQKILQKHLARFLIADVFNTISEDDLVRIERSGNPTKSDVWHYRGDALTEAQVKTLQSQAKSFAQSELWKILKSELQWQANQKGLVKSMTTDDIIASKLMLYLVDVIDSKLKSMSH